MSEKLLRLAEQLGPMIDEDIKAGKPRGATLELGLKVLLEIRELENEKRLALAQLQTRQVEALESIGIALNRIAGAAWAISGKHEVKA